MSAERDRQTKTTVTIQALLLTFFGQEISVNRPLPRKDLHAHIMIKWANAVIHATIKDGFNSSVHEFRLSCICS